MSRVMIQERIPKHLFVCLFFSFFLFFFFSFCFVSLVRAAELYIEPEAGDRGLGDTFVTNVRIDNDEACVNAARVVITYPTETLRAVDFSRGGSIFSLWIEEPTINTGKGTITFAGGIPGGYCGRIQGDPSQSNVLGKVVFTVIDATAKNASVHISNESEVYLNDGLGTKADLKVRDTTYTILPAPVYSSNQWLAEVDRDETPPDKFAIEVQSTRGVFGGKYYIVFATVDKQSGLDHFEIFERGGWHTVTSPYVLKDQTPSDIKLKAIDKAGNERLGDYAVDAPLPPRQTTIGDYAMMGGVTLLMIFLIFAAIGVKLYHDRLMLGKLRTVEEEAIAEDDARKDPPSEEQV